MVTSQFDPCMFSGDRVIAVAFVDDILFWSTDEKFVMVLGLKFRDQSLLLQEEHDAAGFLGVTMNRNEDGSIKLKQVGLIGRIPEALCLDTKLATNHLTPAEHNHLVKDAAGEGPQGSMSYSSVVGTLMYLPGHSRPDIAYAVSCCSR